MSQLDQASWPTPGDPFTAAYMAYARMLLASTYLTATAGLKLGNLNVWCDGVTQTLGDSKGMIQPGNTPEVTLIQTSYVPHPQGSTGRSASFMLTINLVSITDTMQITKINAIKYGITGAFQWADPANNWTFNGAKFIKDYTIAGGGDGNAGITLPTLQATDAQRGLNAQGTLLTTTFEIFVDRAVLPK